MEIYAIAYIRTLAAISIMTKETINKTKKIVIPTFMILFIIGGIESVATSNEFGLTDIIIDKFLIPIIILSTLMSAYWILLTDDFWYLYEGIDTQIGTIAKTLGKFLIWIPAMGLCFYLDIQGILSIYNRTAGEEKLTIVSGQIIDKDNYRSRYYFEIDDSKLKRNVEIKISSSDFERYSIGDQYSTERKIGALGLIYN